MTTQAARRRRAPSHARPAMRAPAWFIAAPVCAALAGLGMFLAADTSEQPTAVFAQQPAAETAEPAPKDAASWDAAPGPATRDRYVTDGTWMTAEGGLEPVDGEGFADRHQPSGSRQHATHAHGPSRTAMDLVFAADGLRIDRLRMDNPAFSAEFDLAQSELLLPAGLAKGATWRWEAVTGDGATTMAHESRVARRETLTSTDRSRAEPAAVIVTNMTLSGAVRGTVTQTAWWSPDGRRLLQLRESGSGRVGANVFRFDTLMRLAEVTTP